MNPKLKNGAFSMKAIVLNIIAKLEYQNQVSLYG